MVADAMPVSLNRLRYLYHATPQDYYLNSMLPLRKGESYSFSMDQIRKNLDVLCEWNYREKVSAGGFAPHDGMDLDTWNGLQEEYTVKSEHLAEENGRVLLPERSEWAIRDMVCFCKKQGIRIVFFATPVPEFVTDSVNNYEKYADAVCRLLKEVGGEEYLDFNLISFDRKNAEYYNDDFHLSGMGAEAFTKELCEWVWAKNK